MADNNYTLGLTFDGFGNIAYGSTETQLGTAEAHTFNPAYGLSAIRVQNLSVSASNNIGFALSANRTFPTTLTWNGAIGQMFNFLVSANNTAVHASALTGTVNVYASAYGILSAGVTGTIQNATSYSSDDTFIALGDVASPSGITGFAGVAGSLSVQLTWTNPTDPDLASVNVRRSSTTPITAIADGSLVYSGLLTSYLDTGFQNADAGTNFYYGAYALDNVAKASSIVELSATPTFGVWATEAEHARLYTEGII
jgi:hypothetical protein